MLFCCCVTTRFYRHGGLQLNVRVLSERGEHFDETNAASALLTNACFRREDIKAAYGTPEIGAPAALSYVCFRRLFFKCTFLNCCLSLLPTLCRLFPATMEAQIRLRSAACLIYLRLSPICLYTLQTLIFSSNR